MNKIKAFIVAGACGLALSGCATYSDGYGYGSGYSGSRVYNPGYSTPSSRYMGTVTSVTTVDLGHSGYRSGSNTSGLGAIAGAIIGGAVGNQIGDGTGRTLATVGGAVAGGYIGNRIEENRRGSRYSNQWGQQVQVRLDNGQYVTLVQPGTSLRVGYRVMVEGYGSNARAIRR